MSKKYTVMSHGQHYDKESCQNNIGQIKHNVLFNESKVSVPELAKMLTDGYSVVLGKLEPTADELERRQKGAWDIYATNSHWVSQTIFAVDIDNEYKSSKTKNKKVKATGEYYISPEKAIEMCREAKIMPAFIYETYSSTKEHQRFRAVFVMTKEVKDKAEHLAIMNSLVELFTINGLPLMDLSCRDLSRVFYPGTKLLFENYNTKVSPAKLIKEVIPSYYTEPSSSDAPKMKKDDIRKASSKKDNPRLMMIVNNEFDKLKRIVAEQLEDSLSPCGSKAEGTSTFDRTVNSIYIKKIKDYCPTEGRYPMTPVTMRIPGDIYRSAHAYPMHQLFDLPFKQHFNCILPDHDDSTASARFEQRHKDGAFIYHCYGCGHTSDGKTTMLDIFNLLERLTGFSHRQVIKKVCDLLNFNLETQWQIEMRAEIHEYRRQLRRLSKESDHPLLFSKLTRTRTLGFFLDLLDEIDDKLVDFNYLGFDQIIYFANIKGLSKKFKDQNKTGVSTGAINNKLDNLSDLGLIRFLSDEEVPDKILKASQERRRLKFLKENVKHKYRNNFITVPLYRMKLFDDAEEIIREQKARNIRKTNLSRQNKVWNGGKEKADQRFVQDKELNVKTKDTLAMYERAKIVIQELIDKKGYTTEKEILSHKRIRGIKQKKELLTTVMPELLRGLDLKDTYYNKNYKEKLNIKQPKNKPIVKPGGKMIIRAKDEIKK